MKHTLLLFFISCYFFQAKPCIGQATKKAATVLVGIFDGRTPCQELAGQLDEKTTSECIKIKWRLTLYKDPASDNSGTYELIGFAHKKNNPRIGKWHISKGTAANPEAIVYELDQAGRPSLFLQKVDDNILFFLDRNKKMMVGNRDFSYTLNKKQSEPPH